MYTESHAGNAEPWCNRWPGLEPSSYPCQLTEFSQSQIYEHLLNRMLVPDKRAGTETQNVYHP